METRRTVGKLVILGALWLAAFFITAGTAVPAWAQNETAWQRQAEENFYLPPGTAGKLMTKHEWEQHWKAMANMGVRHQSRYRREWHVKMMQRAQQRGIRLPGLGNGQGAAQGMGTGRGGQQGMGSGGQ